MGAQIRTNSAKNRKIDGLHGKKIAEISTVQWLEAFGVRERRSAILLEFTPSQPKFWILSNIEVRSCRHDVPHTSKRRIHYGHSAY